MGAEMAGLASLLPRRHDEDAVPDGGRLPVLPALRGLLPGGLKRGTVVTVGHWGLLCLAVAAGASAAGAWGAAVGVPPFGGAAAGGGGRRWPEPWPPAADPGSGHGLATGGGLAA